MGQFIIIIVFIQMSHIQQFATAYHFTITGITQRVKTFTWNFLLMTRHCVMKSANMLKHVQGIRMKMTHRNAFWVAILCSLKHHLVFPVVSTKRHASHVCIAYIYIIISWCVSSLIYFKVPSKISKQNPFVNVKRMPCFI